MKWLPLLAGLLGLLTSVSFAQDSALPPCSDAEWEVLVGVEENYYPLINRSVFLRDLDTLIEAAEEHVRWRSELLSQLPDCREGLELGILMAQMIGDALLSSAFEYFLGVAADENPLTPPVTAGSTRIYELYLREPVAGDERQQETANGEPLCSLFATGADYDLTAGYAELFEAAGDAATMADLLDLSANQVAWRQQLWRQLPACSEAYDALYALSHLTSDLVAVIALLAAGVELESNPYFDAIGAAQSTLQDYYSEQALRQAPEHPPLQVNLPACGEDALHSLAQGEQGYVDLVFQMNAGVYSNDEMIAFAKAMIAWRDAWLSTAPPCADAVAVALMQTWLTGDFFGDTVAMWIGIPASDNFYAELRGKNNARLTRLAQEISSSDWADAPAVTEGLPSCDDAQLDEVFGNMLANIQNMSENAGAIRDSNGLLSYAYYQEFLRNLVWENLPPCSEAFQMAMAMNLHATDAVSAQALRFVGVEDGDNPFLQQLSLYESRYAELAASVGREP